MSTPLWLSHLSHDHLTWAGLPQPEAPPLWARWWVPSGAMETSSVTPIDSDYAGSGWVEVPRVEWPAPQGGGE